MAKIDYEKLAERYCEYCGEKYKPTGPAQKACERCRRKLANIDRQVSMDIARFKKFGTYETIGKGNVQGRGEYHHSYKNGVGSYTKIGKLLKDSIGKCEICGKDLSNVTRYDWCTHHRDCNRENNNVTNLQLLCKRCHLILHGCISHLPQYKRAGATTILTEYLQAWGSGGNQEEDPDCDIV